MDNENRNYQQVLSDTRHEWNKQLGKIEVHSDNPDKLTQFYTHWYHTLIHPNIFNDINGEYIGADFAVHKVTFGENTILLSADGIRIVPNVSCWPCSILKKPPT